MDTNTPYSFKYIENDTILWVKLGDFTPEQARLFFDEYDRYIRTHPPHKYFWVLFDAADTNGTWTPYMRKRTEESLLLSGNLHLRGAAAVLLEDKLLHRLIRNVLNIFTARRVNEVELKIFLNREQALVWLRSKAPQPAAV